jgi:type I restriction enzyme M protein
MANSAGDARGSELEIRKKLIQSGAVDVMVTIGTNFFYTVTLPCTLWFLDRAKHQGPKKGEVLFLDARNYYRQVTRSIREFTPEQLEFLANIVRLYRGEAPEFETNSQAMLDAQFPNREYRDVSGLCKVAPIDAIEAQGWSLNPGRYVGVSARPEDELDFSERLGELTEKFEALNSEARDLEVAIASNMNLMLAGVGR